MSKPVCPDCGSALDIEPNCVIEEPYFPKYMIRDEPLPRRNRPGTHPVAFCTGCEFVMEITPMQGFKLDKDLAAVTA